MAYTEEHLGVKIIATLLSASPSIHVVSSYHFSRDPPSPQCQPMSAFGLPPPPLYLDDVIYEQPLNPDIDFVFA